MINEFSWKVYPNYYYPNISIARSNAKFFGIDDSFFDLSRNNRMVSMILPNLYNYIKFIFFSNQFQEGTYGKKFRKGTRFEQLKHSLTKLFARSSCVERIMICNLEGLNVLNVILCDVIVNNLEFSGLCRNVYEHR